MASPVFEQHYKDYLKRLAGLDFTTLAPDVGGRLTTGPGGRGLEIFYFNRPYRISAAGIRDGAGQKPGYDTCIILSRYLVMAGDRGKKDVTAGAGQDNWAGFRDLKDSGPLTVYFRDNVETAIAGLLAGRMSDLKQGLDALNPSRPGMDLQYDLAVKINALPLLPMLVLANDAEDGFPATCSVLFESGVETVLDAECIAMIGHRLAKIIRKLLS